MMRLAILLIGLAIASDAVACRVARAEHSVPPQDLIGRTRNIILARVVKAEFVSDFHVEYTFKKIAAVSGSSAPVFTLAGWPLLFASQSETFNDHTDPTFWSVDNMGRSATGTDCEIHAAFSVGATYLLFLDKPHHIKSFEQIYRTDGDRKTKDKWLQYVEDNVRR